jgi:adenosylcobinamide-phosphate synthase
VNTLDAMVGHRNERYAEFGWASARLDDALNFLPARLSACLAALFAPVIGGDPLRSVRTWRRDAPGHPSPNAGPVEAAFAGALGIRLGGVNTYAGVPEDRHTLGVGPDPGLHDIDRANGLALWVGRGALAVAVSLSVLAHRRSRSARAPSEEPRQGR